MFSLSASSPDGDDSRYLRWHHLDHLPAAVRGGRACCTASAGCRRRSAERSDRCSRSGSNRSTTWCTTCSANPSPRPSTTSSPSATTSSRSAGSRSGSRTGWSPAASRSEAHAAASALVTADVVPYRPNRGAYLVIEQTDPPGASARWSPEHVDAAARHRRGRRALVVRAHHAAARRVQQERLQRRGVLPRRGSGGGRAGDRGRARRPLGRWRDPPRVRGAVRVTATLRLRAPPPTRIDRTANLRQQTGYSPLC